MLFEFIIAVVVWIISIRVGGFNPLLDVIVIPFVFIAYAIGSHYVENNVSD